jgi:hypothetical protein
MTVDRRPIRTRLSEWFASEEFLLLWVQRPHARLGGRTPGEAILAGAAEEVHAILDRWAVRAEE